MSFDTQVEASIEDLYTHGCLALTVFAILDRAVGYIPSTVALYYYDCVNR